MSADNKWLVKSSDSILGPYEFDRVVENIFNGDIHLLDEIKGPYERWRPIKDHSLFAAAIEKLKASTYQRRTDTTSEPIMDGHTQTDLSGPETLSITEAIDGQTETTTPQVPYVPDTVEQTVIYTPVGHEETVTKTPIPGGGSLPDAPPQGVPQPTQSYQVSKKKRFPVAFIFSFLIIVIGSALALVHRFNQERLVEQKVSAYAQLTDSALEFLKIGEYDKALKNFSLAYSITPNDPNLLIELSPLMIQRREQYNEAQEILEKLLLANNQKTIRKFGRNIVGLSYSYRGMHNQALASYDEALTMDDQYLPAQLNKAFTLMKMKKFEPAFEVMKRARNSHPEEPIIMYFYILTLLENGFGKDDPVAFKEVLIESGQFLKKFIDFRQEILFMRALAYLKLGAKEQELVKLVNGFLEVDFGLTHLHVRDTSVDFQAWNWVLFRNYYPLFKEVLPDYNFQMVDAFFSLKMKESIAAKTKLEKLLSVNSKDGVLQSLYASSLIAMQDISQAKNALGFINQVDNKTPVANTILRGCLVDGDLNCARAIFDGGHAEELSRLYYHWGNSAIEYLKSRKNAQESVKAGLDISNKFAPLLKIQKQL